MSVYMARHTRRDMLHATAILSLIVIHMSSNLVVLLEFSSWNTILCKLCADHGSLYDVYGSPRRRTWQRQ